MSAMKWELGEDGKPKTKFRGPGRIKISGGPLGKDIKVTDPETGADLSRCVHGINIRWDKERRALVGTIECLVELDVTIEGESNGNT